MTFSACYVFCMSNEIVKFPPQTNVHKMKKLTIGRESINTSKISIHRMNSNFDHKKRLNLLLEE